MVSVGSVEVNFMMKSAKTCHLITVLGLYIMSNSLSSIDLLEPRNGGDVHVGLGIRFFSSTEYNHPWNS